MLVCVVMSCLLLVALWSPAGKRLTSWLCVCCVLSLSQICPGPHQNKGRGLRSETGLCPPVKYLLTVPRRYFFVDHLCYLCLVFVMVSCLFIAALWSPAGKGLTSWLLFVMFKMCFCHCPMWYPGSGTLVDCIDS